jgi:hypothetical protein
VSSPTDHPSVPAVFKIERRPVTGQTEPKHVADHVKVLLQRQLADLAAGIESEAEPASKGIRPFGGFGSAAGLERYITEWKKNVVPTKTMDFTIPVGSRVIGLPYDHSWGAGGGWPLSKLDGEMLVFGGEGFSASGASVILTSPKPLLASVTPTGSYDFSYVSLDNYPSLASQGGLGLLVYANGEALTTRLAVLWTVSGISQFMGNKGSGSYADAVAAETSFGPIRLAPVLLNMTPDVTYEVWMWCWVICQNSSGKAFMSYVKCTIPLVMLDAGPPLVIG